MKKKIVFRIFCVPVFALIVLIMHADFVSAACNVVSTGMNFGEYDVFSAAPLDAEGTISVTCDQAPPPDVMISIGPSSNSGGYDPRAMKFAAGSGLLEYNVYTDAVRTQIWGDGTGNTFTKTGKVQKNNTWENTVYGRIAPLQDVSAGFYNETLVVTITW